MGEFKKAWILSCLLYLASLFLWVLSDTGHISTVYFSDLYQLINLIHLYMVLFILHACCSLDNIPLQKFWDRYALFLLLYGVLIIALNLHEMVFGLPFYIYQITLMIVMITTIFRKWRVSLTVKINSALLFTASGIYTMNTSLYVAFGRFDLFLLLLGILLLLCLNFAFTLLDQHHSVLNKGIQDNYLHQMAEHAVDVVFYYTLKPNPRFAFVSPSVETIVGYKQAEFYKNPVLHIELTHEEDREIIRKAFSLEAVSVNKDFIRWQRRDGEYIYLEFHNTPIFQEDKIVAIEGILRDITDRKLVEQDMLDSKKAKQILLSYISHELKTPITYIVGYAEALNNNLFSNEKDQKNAIELIYQKTLFLQKLVEDLFQLSKMESNQFSYEFMQTKVHKLYHLLEEKYRNDVVSKNISFESAIDSKLLNDKFEVLVDLKRIEQVFSNILHNAIKHTPESGTIQFRCVVDEKTEKIIFSVIDSGSGIPKKELPYIFNKFYTGSNTSSVSTAGSGLGLSLSRLIIEAHKGTIEASSSKQKGTTIRFTIPLYTLEG